jgi:hypothetical protein
MTDNLKIAREIHIPALRALGISEADAEKLSDASVHMSELMIEEIKKLWSKSEFSELMQTHGMMTTYMTLGSMIESAIDEAEEKIIGQKQ